MIVRSVNVPGGAASAVLRLVPATGPIEIGPTGFSRGPEGPHDEGAARSDEHRRAHALYAYPTVHHPFWRTVRAQARVAEPDAPLPPAAFDEHLALEGVQETQLWIGDLLCFPDCTLVVSAPRLPDERFNETLGFPKAAKMVAESRWCGMWLAVRKPGRIAPGDAFQLLPGPRATGLVELFRARVKGLVVRGSKEEGPRA